MAQLFNSKVSIITKTEIRYEGHIYQINPQQQTIALKDVRSFGTEGRRPEHEIPPNQQSYDIIVFKAAEIKELKTFDENKPEENKLETKSEPNPKPPTSVPQFQQPENNQRQGTNPRAFDFDEMLEKANEIEKIKKQEVKPKYNPTSFFDSLSTSTQKQDRQPQQRNQNQIDTDTFGNFYKQRQYNNNNNNNGQRRNNNGTYNNNNNYHNRRQQQRVVYVEKQTQQPSQEQQQQ